MKIKIDYTKNAYENASEYFEKAKKIENKIKTIKERLNKTVEKRIEKNEKIDDRKKEWYEQFAWSKTEKDKLILIGKSAQQNERLLKKYLEEDDLVFHSQAYGASMVILKKGREASESEKKEAAQLAATFGSSWGLFSEDVFAFKKEQIKKENFKKGQINIEGEREWFKNQPIGLKLIYNEEKKRLEIRSLFNNKPKKYFEIFPGKTPRKKTIKEIMRRFKIKTSDFSLLPGKTHNIKLRAPPHSSTNI